MELCNAFVGKCFPVYNLKKPFEAEDWQRRPLA